MVERDVVNGVMFILGTGCQWASPPKDLPPRRTVNDCFRRWDWHGTLGHIHHALHVKCREPAGLAKDWECLNRDGFAFLRWAAIRMMARNLWQETL